MSRKYLCREDYLSEGARLLRRVMRPEATQTQRDAYDAWLKRAQPTVEERRAVLRMAQAGRRVIGA